jgi:hypothetical protein
MCRGQHREHLGPYQETKILNMASLRISMKYLQEAASTAVRLNKLILFIKRVIISLDKNSSNCRILLDGWTQRSPF